MKYISLNNWKLHSKVNQIMLHSIKFHFLFEQNEISVRLCESNSKSSSIECEENCAAVLLSLFGVVLLFLPHRVGGAVFLTPSLVWCCVTMVPALTGTVGTMGTVDNGHDGDVGDDDEERSSPSNGDDGDGHPICFFQRLCCFSHLFLLGGAALPFASRVALLLLPPSVLSPLRLFRAVFDLI